MRGSKLLTWSFIIVNSNTFRPNLKYMEIALYILYIYKIYIDVTGIVLLKPVEDW